MKNKFVLYTKNSYLYIKASLIYLNLFIYNLYTGPDNLLTFVSFISDEGSNERLHVVFTGVLAFITFIAFYYQGYSDAVNAVNPIAPPFVGELPMKSGIRTE